MITTRMTGAEITDADLVARSLGGDRDAFAAIVSRYQSLVCSLAYSATGSLAHSEDLAQETFVTAWKRLRDLREPARLRSWLCGIARNLINNWLRRQGREPSHAAEPLEFAAESAAPEPLPHDQVISREEQNILWRSIAHIPEIYREPLVLFYREQQSVQGVATALDLSEDAVRQRLSRGRKLLHEQVLAFVEGALARTNPGRTFTLGVMAALPAFVTSAQAAAIGATAAKGSTAATTASSVSLAGLVLGPILGFLGGYLGYRASLKSARTPRERQFVIRWTKRALGGVVGFNVLFLTYFFLAIKFWKTHPVPFGGLGIVLLLAYSVMIVFAALRYNRGFQRIRLEEKERHPELFRVENTGKTFKEYRSRRTLLGLPLVHVCGGEPGEQKKVALGWIAIGERAVGVLFAAGGVSVGGISVGAVSMGILTFGGVGIGLVALGGFSIGALAIGGGAVGMFAKGGLAAGWIGAVGGLAVARKFALGGLAVAAHANDSVAREQLGGFLEFMHDIRPFPLLPIVLTCAALLWLLMRRFRPRKDQPQ